jgi:hypothetical protein
MTWYIYRGEDLKRQQVIKFPFYRSLPEDYSPEDLIFNDELIQSESKSPPTYPTPRTTSTNCVLTSDLRSVDESKFKKCVSRKGIPYYEVHYDLVVTIQPAVMKFSLEIRGKEMGSVTANYDWEITVDSRALLHLKSSLLCHSTDSPRAGILYMIYA